MMLQNKAQMIYMPTREEFGVQIFEFREHFLSSISKTKPVIMLMLAYWGIGFVYLGYFEKLAGQHFFIYLETLLPLVVVVLPTFFILSATLGAVRRGKHRSRWALKRTFSNQNIANFFVGVVLMILLCMFMGMYTAIKTSFADLQGFQHDIWQADLDKLLFFGSDPWRIMFDSIHSIALQKFVEINYNMYWHIQVFAIIALAAYADSRSEMKVRYLSSIVWVWVIVGTIFAGLFISAGPAFYGLVTGDEMRFGEQLAILAQHEQSSAIRYQAYLWSAYASTTPSLGTGISAFPSMHVSLVCMNVFFAFEINRKLGFIALIYALFVWVSSVYLAWHYAIDGLAGALLVAVIYYSTRRFMKKASG
ncbi:phosphatase PAP2 family protein [Lentilitoribacter sp. EG35]|uniref:phosphatase PAP2 family protein n=1 Tax=Lentilitoribacter sp. EG35 TaxID=3234192 RepID=UPI003460D100